MYLNKNNILHNQEVQRYLGACIDSSLKSAPKLRFSKEIGVVKHEATGLYVGKHQFYEISRDEIQKILPSNHLNLSAEFSGMSMGEYSKLIANLENVHKEFYALQTPLQLGVQATLREISKLIIPNSNTLITKGSGSDDFGF